MKKLIFIITALIAFQFSSAQVPTPFKNGIIVGDKASDPTGYKPGQMYYKLTATDSVLRIFDGVVWKDVAGVDNITEVVTASTNYTLLEEDILAWKPHFFTGNDITITIPAITYDTFIALNMQHMGTGTITIQSGAGVTFPDQTFTTDKVFSIRSFADDVWEIYSLKENGVAWNAITGNQRDVNLIKFWDGLLGEGTVAYQGDGGGGFNSQTTEGADGVIITSLYDYNATPQRTWLRSDDYGKTWAVVHTAGTIQSNTSIGSKVYQDSSTGVWMSIIGNSTVLRSTDNGLTWATTAVTTNGGNLSGVMLSDNNGTWVAGGGTGALNLTKGVLVSTDDGLTWNFIQTNETAATISTDENGTWLLVGRDETGFYRSTNNAVSFSNVPVNNIDFSLNNYTSNVATYDNGVWLLVMRKINSGSKILRSTNNAFTWTEIPNTEDLEIDELYQVKNKVYAYSTVSTGYFSYDNGLNFEYYDSVWAPKGVLLSTENFLDNENGTLGNSDDALVLYESQTRFENKVNEYQLNGVTIPIIDKTLNIVTGGGGLENPLTENLITDGFGIDTGDGAGGTKSLSILSDNGVNLNTNHYGDGIGNGLSINSNADNLFGITKNSANTIYSTFGSNYNNAVTLDLRSNANTGAQIRMFNPQNFGTGYWNLYSGEDFGIFNNTLPALYIDFTTSGVTLPNTTTADITTLGAKAVVTKEYGDANYLGGGADNLGNHTMTEPLKTADFAIESDQGATGVLSLKGSVSNSYEVNAFASTTPEASSHVFTTGGSRQFEITRPFPFTFVDYFKFGEDDVTSADLFLYGNTQGNSGGIHIFNHTTDDTQIDKWVLSNNLGRFRITGSGGTNGSGIPAFEIDDVNLNVSFGNYDFPRLDGLAGQVLKTNGADILTWQDDNVGGQVNSAVAGTGIDVDSTDPANPIITAERDFRFTATVGGAFDLDWTGTRGVWVIVANAALTLSDTNLPQGVDTKVIELIVSGNFALTLPATWTALPYNDPYDGTGENHIVVTCVNGNSGSEQIYYSLTNI